MVEANNGSESQQYKYTEDFATRVRAVLHGGGIDQALDSGDKIVGFYLRDNRGVDMSPDAIIKALKDNNPEKVLEAAETAKKIEALYSEWLKLPSFF